MTAPGPSTQAQMTQAQASQPAPIYVFDSSAMLAYLKGEPEGILVGRLFKTAGAVLVAHTVNLCEVFYNFGPPSIAQNKTNAENALKQLHAVCGVQERNDMDGAFWRDVALLIAERRAMPRDPARPSAVPTLALGDAFGVALSRRLGAESVTKDRSEIEPLHNAGLVKALFIR